MAQKAMREEELERSIMDQANKEGGAAAGKVRTPWTPTLQTEHQAGC